MDTSILTSIKNLLGISEEDTSFDKDIVMFINGVLMSLNQIGVGPTEGYFITDTTETWAGLIGTRTDLGSVPTYVYLKVRLLFDPPQSGFLIEAIKNQITEFEWRLKIQAEGVIIDG